CRIAGWQPASGAFSIVHCRVNALTMIAPVFKICFLAFLLGLWPNHLLLAVPIRISFLRDAALSDTTQALRKIGCNQESIAMFTQLVDRYHNSGFEFDLAKFPPSTNGFYTFSNAQHLVAALPHPPWKTEHAYEFTCFDTVILLANDHLRIDLKPNERAGKFSILARPTNDLEVIEVATAAEAFTNQYPTWYREVTDGIFPGALQDRRVCLTAALLRHERVLPESVNEETLKASLLEVIRKDCRTQKLIWPKSFDLVLVHQVHLPSRTFATAHAALLFRLEKRHMYLEKAGGSGPFVRLDFDDRADLLVWLAAAMKGLEHEHTHVVATFNDARADILRIATPSIDR
ncbi:MAG TPA: hypothetical protein VJ063_00460, partial [Verrucomicrobiae bacterium]|nr:hypothetical protein [Verrucomicrobiae bacterium]